MTSPNQPPPDGAVTVGGGAFRFGKYVDEKAARELFDIEPPANFGEAMDMLPFVLSQLPTTTMKPWQKWLGKTDEERENGTVAQALVASLAKRPLRSLMDNLWDGFKGTTGSEDKTPEDVLAAAQALTSDVNLALSNAGQATENAESAKDAAYDILAAGSNLIANSDFEKGVSGQPLQGVFSDEVSYSGNKSLKMTSNGSGKSYDLLSGGLTPRTIPADAGDFFLLDVYVYGKETNTQTSGASTGVRLAVTPYNRFGFALTDAYVSVPADASTRGVWTKMTAYVQMPATTAKVKLSLQLTSAVQNNEVYYFDLATVREVTVAKKADDTATSAQSTASSAQTTATTAQSTATVANTTANTANTTANNANSTATTANNTANTAQSTATSAQSTANAASTTANAASSNADLALVNATDASDLAGQVVESGSNVIANSDFEKGLTSPQPLVGTYSTAQKYSGTRSLLMTANGTTKTFYLLSQGLTPRTVPASEGDVFYCEFYVLGLSVSQTVADGIRFVFEPTNRLGANLTDSYVGLTVSPSLGSWTKVAAYATMPAGTTKFKVGLQIRSTVTSGSFYFDQIIVREVTLAKSAEGTASSAQTTANSAETAAGSANTNLQTVVNGIGQAVDGGSASYTHASAKTKLQLAWANLWDGMRGTSGATVKTPAEVRAEAAALKSKADTTESGLTAANTNHGTLVDNVTKSFMGDDSLSGTTLSNALTAMKKAYEDLTANTKAIQGLQAKRDAAAAKGATYAVDFSNFSTMTAAGFTVSYTGAGASTIGISGGVAQWSVADASARDAKIIYGQSTSTDFQSVRGVMAAPPQVPNGTTPYFYAIARVSADGLNYVWARAYAQSFGNYKADMGYCLNGTEYTWVSNISLTWSLDMRFVAGIGTNARQYQIWSGDKVVYTHTESGTASQLGVNNRRWGAIAQVRNGRTAGKVSSVNVTDNGTPAVNGSFARLVRNSTTIVAYVPNSVVTALSTFWDAAPFESPDVDADTATGTFKVTSAKPYLISARVRLSGNAAALAYLILQKSSNGSTWTDAQWGPAVVTDDGQALSANWVQYLNEGEYVRLAYTRNGTISLNVLNGEPTGSQSYFTIASAEAGE